MVPNPERGEVKCSVCTARVNCLARCLANRAEGEDVIWIGGALPRGFQNLVALEADGLMMKVSSAGTFLRLLQLLYEVRAAAEGEQLQTDSFFRRAAGLMMVVHLLGSL
nr:uncharacterized protein LOC109173561 [Ipomoea batatas]GME18765.1 uncharacterized protein LOC109173561 [Ipomoea batatas]